MSNTETKKGDARVEAMITNHMKGGFGEVTLIFEDVVEVLLIKKKGGSMTISVYPETRK